MKQSKRIKMAIFGGLAVVLAAGVCFSAYLIRRAEAEREALLLEQREQEADRAAHEAVLLAEEAARRERLLAEAEELGRKDAAEAQARREEAAQKAGSTGETITEDEDGNIIIRPNWSREDGPPPAAEQDPAANMASGGGELKVDENETFHGDRPSTPAANPETPPSGSTDGDTPTTPPGTTTPPSGNSGGAEPKNGTINEAGTHKWLKPWGWVEIGSGGSSEPSKGDSNGLSGEKIGSFGGGD